MPSLYIPNSSKTTLRKVLQEYLPSSEHTSEEADAGVRFIRNLARQILKGNEDLADIEFDSVHKRRVGKRILDFMQNDFTKALRQAKIDAKGEVTEGDLVRLVSDKIGQELGKDIRDRVKHALGVVPVWK